MRWEWNTTREAAALLMAEDEWTDAEIGAQLDVNVNTLVRWRKVPEFQARVQEIVRELMEAPRRHAIARRNRRLAELQKRHARLMAVIEARAAHADYQDLPGGDTGLLVRRQKLLGRGADAVLVVEYEVDTGTLKELRELEKQAAIEVGDWSEKREVSGSMRVQQAVEHLSDEELERIARGEGGGNP